LRTIIFVASALQPFVGRFGDQQIHMFSRTRTGSDSCRLSPPRLLRNFLGTGISKSTRRRFNSTSVSRPKLTLTEHRTSRLRAMPAAVPDSLVRLSRARSRRRTEPSSMSFSAPDRTIRIGPVSDRGQRRRSYQEPARDQCRFGTHTGINCVAGADTALLKNKTGCHKPGQSTKRFVWAFCSSLSVA
jgi:hypothetical protein